MSIQTSIEISADAVPHLRLQKSHLAEGVSLAELLVLGGLAASRDEARRLIARDAVRVEGRVIDNAMERLRLSEGTLRLSAGEGEGLRQVLLQAV